MSVIVSVSVWKHIYTVGCYHGFRSVFDSKLRIIVRRTHIYTLQLDTLRTFPGRRKRMDDGRREIHGNDLDNDLDGYIFSGGFLCDLSSPQEDGARRRET